MRLIVLVLLSVSVCLGQTQALRQYLGLTDPQAAAISKLNSDYQQYSSTKQQRIGTVNNELANLYASPSPDPGELGARYLELEAIRRDIAAQLATLQAQAAAQLSAAQVSKIQNLNAAAILQPLISDAQCGFLVDPLPAFADFLLGGVISTVPVTVARVGYFSWSGAIGFMTLPYIPLAPTASFCGSAVVPISVRTYLSLTDAQVSTIFFASASYNDYYVRRQDRISDVNIEIRDETAKPSPDPAALGVRYAELESIGQDIQNAGTQLRQTARATLTPQQSAQLKILQDDLALQPVTAQAQACGLLVLAPGTAAGNLPSIIYPNTVVVTGAISGLPFPYGIGCAL